MEYSTLVQSKSELRKEIQDYKKQWTAEEFDSLNAQLIEQVVDFNLSAFKNIGIYWPIQAKREFRTDLLMTEIKSNQEAHFFLPKADFSNHSMSFHHFVPGQALVEGEKGILEPELTYVIPPQELDLILVPMLICNMQGYRLGYGKGFYDRFLPLTHQNCLKLGVSFFEPIEAPYLKEDWDRALDIVITPDYYHFYK